MGRRSHPWYWRNGYYVKINGQRIKLLEGPENPDNREKAEKIFHRKKAESPVVPRPDSPAATVTSLCDAYVKWVAKNRKAATMRFYRDFLEDFCRTDRPFGNLPIHELKPFHIDQWFDFHKDTAEGEVEDGRGGMRKWTFRPWNETTRYNAVRAVEAALNWGVRMRYLTHNPIAKLPKPEPLERDRIWSQDEETKILDAIKDDDDFRELLFCIRVSGCRPGEMARAEKRFVNWDVPALVYPAKEQKTGRKTKMPRIVRMPKAVLAILRRRAEKHPTGPLFRTRTGTAWNKNNWGKKFRRLREMLGLPNDVILYGLRHTFTTNAVPEIGAASTAALLGHTDLRMLKKYMHLEKLSGHLQDAAEKVARDADLTRQASTADGKKTDERSGEMK